MNKVELVIDKKYQNMSIKEVLKDFYVGRPKIEEIRVNKLALLNDLPTNIDAKLSIGDKISFLYEEKVNFEPFEKKLDVVYEDEQILIVNKPSGILIHPDKEENNRTLCNIVANYYKQNSISNEVRYIHRIDFETSGIVVFAKDFLTFAKLNHQIETHEVIRKYYALVEGVTQNQGIIDKPIGRDRHNSNRYRVSNSNGAKDAVTNYKLIKAFGKYSLIECKLETGRTHQIRVHMSSIGHPLLGDTIYGGSKKMINRVALHSHEVKLVNPITNKQINVIVDLPQDLKNIIGDE